MSNDSIQAIKSEYVDPICPHCEEVIKNVLFKRVAGMLGKRYIYFCQNCHKVLGISHRKGFWMG